MTEDQTGDLLELLAAANVLNRLDERTPDVWHAALADLEYRDCMRAAAHLIRTQQWVKIADIRQAVLAERRDRLERHTEAHPPLGDTGDATYRPALLAERRAIASGHIAPQPVPALPAGETGHQPGRARAILATVGSSVPGPREGVVNVLAVACSICHARPGRPCTSPRNPARRRADAHPARLEDARRVAAGQPPAGRDDEQQELERRVAAARAATARMEQPPEPDDDFDPRHRTKTAAKKAAESEAS